MIIPSKLKKDELIKYITQKCEHRHYYTEHPNCFEKDIEKHEKIGFLDIEATNLKADFGIVLTYCIKDKDSDKIYGRKITREEVQSNTRTYDKHILQDCVNDIRRFDKIITYFGTCYDLPFLRTRCLKWGIKFPTYGEVKQFDLYYLCKSKLNLHRKSLEVVTKWLGIEGKNHVDNELWLDATFQQTKKSLNYIFDHNKRDVIILQDAYERLEDYAKCDFKSM